MLLVKFVLVCMFLAGEGMLLGNIDLGLQIAISLVVLVMLYFAYAIGVYTGSGHMTLAQKRWFEDHNQ